MKYKLIAMDMDNTLLNKQKEVSPRTAEALRRAAAAGHAVVFATGRSYIECKKYFDAFPEVQWFIGNTGATVQNVRTGELLYSAVLGRAICSAAEEAIRGLDCMATVHAGDYLYVGQRVRQTLARYECDVYQQLFEETAEWVPDIFTILRNHAEECYKLDLFFHSEEDQRLAAERLSKLGVSLSGGTRTNIEVSPANVSKGNALRLLCDRIGIPAEEAIACGDADNDLSMVSVAGLGVAMGNATSQLKEAADFITADCDHDGIADVVDRFLHESI